jgi:O-antigen/teichoic acid export membrane protein
MLADGGLGGTLAREQESSSLVWSSAFWLLLLLGVVLALASAGFGVVLGYLANQPRLPGLIALLSLSILFFTLSVVPAARLTRRKHMGTFAGADIAANITGAIVAVACALYGWGAWSLAAQYVVTYAVRSIILNAAAFYWPEARCSLTALQPHLVSGSIQVASRMTEYAGRMTENFLVDRIFGTVLLGSFSFANQISRFATEVAGNVVWATLYTFAVTGEKDEVVLLHRKLCRLLGLALFPMAFLAAAGADDLIAVFLGPKWADMTPLIRVLLPLYALSAICVQSSPILLAYGRFDIQLWCMSGLAIGRTVSVLLGFWIGLQGVLYGITIVTLLFCAAQLIFPAKVTGCEPRPILTLLIRPAISAIVATAAFVASDYMLPLAGLKIAIDFAIGLLVYAAVMLLIDRRQLRDDVGSIKLVMRPTRAIPSAT